MGKRDGAHYLEKGPIRLGGEPFCRGSARGFLTGTGEEKKRKRHYQTMQALYFHIMFSYACHAAFTDTRVPVHEHAELYSWARSLYHKSSKVNRIHDPNT